MSKKQQAKIEAYVMIPITIALDVTSPQPTVGSEYRDWFHEQLRSVAEKFTDSDIEIADEGFVDVTEFLVGSGGTHTILSRYQDRKLFESLVQKVSEKLETNARVKRLCEPS